MSTTPNALVFILIVFISGDITFFAIYKASSSKINLAQVHPFILLIPDQTYVIQNVDRSLPYKRQWRPITLRKGFDNGSRWSRNVNITKYHSPGERKCRLFISIYEIIPICLLLLLLLQLRCSPVQENTERNWALVNTGSSLLHRGLFR